MPKNTNSTKFLPHQKQVVSESGSFASATASQTGAQGQQPKLTLTFFSNANGVPVADLRMGEKRLLATTHPATIVAAMFAMKLTELTVVTVDGRHTAELNFFEQSDDIAPLPVYHLRMQLKPELFQFRHLAPAESYFPILEGLDLFAAENWHNPSKVADEHLRAAHHHLPKNLIRRPLVTIAPKGWKKTLARRNGWIYYPFC